ncbi:hypothetical protein Tco_0320038 [Tanacetum coccineum]
MKTFRVIMIFKGFICIGRFVIVDALHEVSSDHYLKEVVMEPDIKNITLNEYSMYEGRHRDLARNYTTRKNVAPVRNKVLVYPDSDEEDKDRKEVDIDSMPLAEYDLYMAMQCSKKSDVQDTTYGAKNLRMMKHEVPNRCDEETVGDTDHESGNLLNFPTFPVTNEFASVCIQDDENINVSTTEEIEEDTRARRRMFEITLPGGLVKIGDYRLKLQHSYTP